MWDAIALACQVASASAAGFAAWMAMRAVTATRDAANAQVRATVLSALLAEYAATPMYDALRRFGRFASCEEHAVHFAELRLISSAPLDATPFHRRPVGVQPAIAAFPVVVRAAELGALRSPDAAGGLKDQHGLDRFARMAGHAWVVQRIGEDQDLGTARRLIHHFYKSVWSHHAAGLLTDSDLWHVTRAHSGWGLWRDEVLPVTLAQSAHQSLMGRRIVASDAWAGPFIALVDALTAPR